MTWEEVFTDPNLQDLPYKIELNEWEQGLLTQRPLRHGAYKARIGAHLRHTLIARGQIVMGCAIKTYNGTKAADVTWFTACR